MAHETPPPRGSDPGSPPGFSHEGSDELYDELASLVSIPDTHAKVVRMRLLSLSMDQYLIGLAYGTAQAAQQFMLVLKEVGAAYLATMDRLQNRPAHARPVPTLGQLADTWRMMGKPTVTQEELRHLAGMAGLPVSG